MITCTTCGGIGELPVGEVRQGDRRQGRFVMQWIPCQVCAGSAREIQWNRDDLAEAEAIGNTGMAAVIRAYLDTRDEPDPEPTPPAGAMPKVTLRITMVNGSMRVRHPNEARAADIYAGWLDRKDVAFVRWMVDVTNVGSWMGGARGAGYAPVQIVRDTQAGRIVAISQDEHGMPVTLRQRVRAGWASELPVGTRRLEVHRPSSVLASETAA